MNLNVLKTPGVSAAAAAALVIATVSAAAATLPVPHVFAPGVISGPSNDGAPSFTPDGRTLFYEQTNGRWATIVESHLVDGKWTKPVLTAFAGRWSCQQPAVSPDGNYVIFESTRPGPDGARAAHLYRADRTANGWGEAVELPATVNIAHRVFKPSIAANGDLYFMADSRAAATSGAPIWRLYVARRDGGRYRQTEALPFSDGTYQDVDPYIAPDQSYLVFSSKGRPAFDDGHEHLFITRRTASGWSAPAAIRYAGDGGYDDGEANVGPDGRTLYFTSGRTMPFNADRTIAEARADLARLELWDNSNANVWMIPLDAATG